MHSTNLVQISTGSTELLRKLAGVQDELVELAFRLDQQGRMDAAEVAVTTAARIGELCTELAPGNYLNRNSGITSPS
jgi:hypothetical protein